MLVSYIAKGAGGINRGKESYELKYKDFKREKNDKEQNLFLKILKCSKQSFRSILETRHKRATTS